MKVHKPAEIPAQPVNAPLFTGGPVTRQTLLTPEASEYFNLGIVNFGPGARNKMHTHSSDQVLFVTAGKDIMATETEQQVIVPATSSTFSRKRSTGTGPLPTRRCLTLPSRRRAA